MLTIELPTRTRDYVIAIRDMPREDALTLSYLATRAPWSVVCPRCCACI